MTINLSRCKFCGSDDIMVSDAADSGQQSEYSRVICAKCHAGGPLKMSDDAASRAWNELVCPFCGEADFDAVGLKMHLTMWCGEYAT